MIVFTEDRASLNKLAKLGFPKESLQVAKKRGGRFNAPLAWTVPEAAEHDLEPMTEAEALEIRRQRSVTFGNARNWTFGARTPEGDAGVWEEILFKSNRYRNALVAQELDRRETYRQARKARFPRLVELERMLAEIEAEIATLRTAIQQGKAQARTRKPDLVLQARVKSLREKKQPLWQEMRVIGAVAREDAKLKRDAAAIDAADLEIRHALRAASGIPWACYQTIEAGVPHTGYPPRFHRYEHTGRIVVNIQNRPLTVESALAGTDSRVKFTFVRRGRRGRGGYYIAHLRLNAGAVLRVPCWLDRDLPADARISSVWAKRFKVATEYRWELGITLTRREWEERVTGSGCVAVNLGWRATKEGLRVAYWVGNDGREGQVLLPWERSAGLANEIAGPDVNAWGKAHSLQSIRARAYNAARARLAAWLPAYTPPTWLAERLQTLSHWRSQSQARLASVLIQWRTNRFAGDDTIFADLEAWRKQDKHLYLWQGYQMRAAVGGRDNFYRRAAKELSEKFGWFILTEIDYAQLAKNQQPEEDPDGVNDLCRMVASSGRLQQILKERFTNHLTVDAAYATVQCHVCGEITSCSRRKVNMTCSHCGAEWDQDRNHCLNALARAKAMFGDLGLDFPEGM